jgi:hypothetical protein
MEMLAIPDLSIEARTEPDRPWFCVSASPLKVKGEAGVKWDLVLAWEVEKDDVVGTVLPEWCAQLRELVLLACEHGESTEVVRKPKLATTITLDVVAGDTQEQLVHQRRATLMKRALKVHSKGYRIVYTFRIDGDGREQFATAVESSVLVTTNPSQKLLPLVAAKKATPLVARVDGEQLPPEPSAESEAKNAGPEFADKVRKPGRRPRAS